MLRDIKVSYLNTIIISLLILILHLVLSLIFMLISVYNNKNNDEVEIKY